MTKEQIDLSLKENKLQLSLSDKLSHFAIVGFFLFIFFLLGFYSVKSIVTGKFSVLTELPALLIPLSLALLFYRIQSNRLLLREIPVNVARVEIAEKICKLGKEYSWEIIQSNTNCIIAKTHPSFTSGSWGEQITVLFKKDGILVNSICDPDKKISLVSMGRNKMNVEAIANALQKETN